MGTEFMSALELGEVAKGRATDIGGSMRHIWFGAIYDRPKLESFAARVDAAGLTAEQQKQVTRAATILKRGDTAGVVEKAFGDLGKLEEALPALAKKSGAYQGGQRVLVSMTREEFAELTKRIKG